MTQTNYADANPYAPPALPAAQATASERGAFILRTYNHLAGAIIAFIGMEIVLFRTGIADAISPIMFSSGFGWLAILGAFMILGTIFSKIAASAVSAKAQYGALGAYVFLEALILMPLLWMAQLRVGGGGLIMTAGLITIASFIALSGIVFATRKDFSFLRTGLIWAGIVAIIAIVASVVIGFQLGIIFSALMILLAGGFILYETSNIIHHYPTDRHVSACLALFAAIAMMFWYVLRIVMSLSSD